LIKKFNSKFSIYLLDELLEVIALVKETGMKVGLAFNPHTKIPPCLKDILPSLDLVLLMTVEPGFGG
jgi:ribulose-phosphate 3-epimerase